MRCSKSALGVLVLALLGSPVIADTTMKIQGSFTTPDGRLVVITDGIPKRVAMPRGEYGQMLLDGVRADFPGVQSIHTYEGERGEETISSSQFSTWKWHPSCPPAANPSAAAKLLPPASLVAALRGDASVYPAVGGTAGDSFQEFHLQPDEWLYKIEIDWCKAIDGIVLTTNTGRKVTMGTMGGFGDHPEETKHFEMGIDKSNYIKSIAVHTDNVGSYKVVVGLLLNCSRSGAITIGNGPFDQQLVGGTAGSEFAGFWTRHGTVIDCLGLISRYHDATKE